jgi:hypothetical protein
MGTVSVGAISGLLLGATTSFLITGRLFHPFQAKTPATWRPESWRQHVLALLLHMIAGASLGLLFMLSGSPSFDWTLAKLMAAAWAAIASCLLMHALYVNWHAGFVIGILIDWAVFVGGVLLACAWFRASTA